MLSHRNRVPREPAAAAALACEERDYKGSHAFPSNITREDSNYKGLPPLPSNITREVTHRWGSSTNHAAPRGKGCSGGGGSAARFRCRCLGCRHLCC